MRTDDNEHENTPIIWSIGHSVKLAQDIAEVLAMNDIESLIDCRSVPYSRYNPQFNKTRFSNTLSGYAIAYEWRGDNVGGKKLNVNYDEALDEFAARASRGERIALMCSEGDYKKCHRGTELAPELIRRGIAVHHMLPSKDIVILQPSEITP